MKNKIQLLLFVFIIVLAFILRVYKLDNNPPSLYWDEVSLGYNAYSILTTGIDEHGEPFPLARFIAFGDFKPPGYIYATVPSIWLFGLNEFAVRFPSAVSGVFLVIITYLIAKEILKNTKAALLSSLLLSVSPWSLQISRGAFEANLASSFNALGVLMLLKLKKGKGWYILLSLFFFIMSFYTFNANRIIAPFLLTTLLIIKFKDVFLEKKWLIVSFVIGVLFMLPSYSYLVSRESKIRFQEVSIFTNLEVLKKSNERISLHNNSLVGKIFHNRRVAYAREFLGHYFDHFKTDYLFISGDKNPRLSTQAVGELYILTIPFLIIGIIFLIKNIGRESLPLFFWSMISLIPSSVAKETPHALRTASMLPIFELITAYGIWFVARRLSNRVVLRTVFIIGLSGILFFNFYYYLHSYYVHYPIDWATEWQYGYKETIKAVAQVSDNYDYIVVTESLGRPYVYFLFYNKVSPRYYLDTRIASRDWFGFWSVEGFDKYRFGLNQLSNLKGKILVVGTKDETKSLANVIKTIYTPKGEVVFRIGSY